MATEVRCFALFPAPGAAGAEAFAALGQGEEGVTGPGQGDTERGLVCGGPPGAWADSGINIYKEHAQSKLPLSFWSDTFCRVSLFFFSSFFFFLSSMKHCSLFGHFSGITKS